MCYQNDSTVSTLYPLYLSYKHVIGVFVGFFDFKALSDVFCSLYWQLNLSIQKNLAYTVGYTKLNVIIMDYSVYPIWYWKICTTRVTKDLKD